MTNEERRAVAALPVHTGEFAANQSLVRVGDRPSQCCLLLEGFAFRYQRLGDGRRQVMCFHIPDDVPDLLSLHLPMWTTTLAPSFGARWASFPTKIYAHSFAIIPGSEMRSGAIPWWTLRCSGSGWSAWGDAAARASVAHLVCEPMMRLNAGEGATLPSVDDCSRSAPPTPTQGWLKCLGTGGWFPSESPAGISRNARLGCVGLRSMAGTDQIAERFMQRIRHPNVSQFTRPK